MFIHLQVRDGPGPVYLPAVPRTICHPGKTYIITGGLGGFGLELAQWLIERGAKSLVLTSTSGVKTGYQARKLDVFKQLGAEVTVSSANVVYKRETRALLETTTKPVGAIFHLAVVS